MVFAIFEKSDSVWSDTKNKIIEFEKWSMIVNRTYWNEEGPVSI